jgi:hypothetical protein
MNDQPVPYMPTDKATILSLQARVDELEHMLRHFDRSQHGPAPLCPCGGRACPDTSEWQ